MNELDVMKQDSEEILTYWKKRLEREKKQEKQKGVSISIVPDTLEWFLWMIENGRSPIEPKEIK